MEKLMSNHNTDTGFAPATRSSTAEIDRQVKLIEPTCWIGDIIALMPEVVLILNGNRQIVYANNTAMKLLKEKEGPVYGHRPGEILDCIHASESPGGCGTTVFCSTCGAVKAILTSLRGLEDIQECRITQKESGNALDLRVWCYPLPLKGEVFVLFVLNDISDEKRRRILERIFFHDLLNTAGGIKSFCEILGEASDSEAEEFLGIIKNLSTRLIDEINAQRQLLSAEHNELAVKPETIDIASFLKDTADIYRSQDIARGKIVITTPLDDGLTINSDKALLSRVLGNMIKNALEAIEPGNDVTVGCKQAKGEVVFNVHNPGLIPPEVQLQIFQRSFSTKDAGRGLGTYSMRLLSERYLKGRVGFTSTLEQGTIFTARYPLALSG
jgi:hypothetical protein